MTRVFTIGNGGKNAREFFTILAEAGVKKIFDVRLYNTSQLAGYSKREDLEYFVETLLGGEYRHLPSMAPTKELLGDYKKGLIDWSEYEVRFGAIINQRRIERYLTAAEADMGCFLCSEASAEKCHRRLVAEYLSRVWSGTAISHL